ncbi:DUF3833 domain-containing protein [Paraferrimonas haliotis]|uniref:DUF3833 domain-containing protein n=1 Tax=Paraferrimonas haliotis TaxID=2013866 RepID=A0AA37WZR0_9GAMM|nr:DUF3833 domain-containing protein [Paraferrimonas haliotis]GLS84066.1 hypothetical protein GCM10007894_20430 [Paraferrimonas haliotis]
MYYRIAIVVLLVGLVMGCGSASIDDYKDEQQSNQKIDLKNFFEGKLIARGVVLDYQGKVTRRFSVDMQASWEGNVGTLEEWFQFADGEKSERTWVITKLADGNYTGTANDITGVATGEAEGFALRWKYDMTLVVDEDSYDVVFDDWLFQVTDDEIINRSFIKKWGVTVGEVILSIRKLP